MASVSVYEGVKSILEHIRANQQHILSISTANLGGYMGIWGKIPLLGVLCGCMAYIGVRLGAACCSNVSVYEGVDSILERIKSIFCQFNRKIWAG